MSVDPGLDRSEHAPLAPLTTFEVGGPAEVLVEAESGSRLRTFLAGPCAGEGPNLIGGGSNLLIADSGLPGVTIVLRARPDAARVETRDDGVVRLDAALDWPSLADHLVGRGLAGVESLCGIPGTVGGAVVQNIGAYGYELAGLVEEVRVFDCRRGRERVFGPDRCGFGYRTSRFKTAGGRFIVLETTLRLQPGGRHRVRYRELGEELLEDGRSDQSGEYPIDRVRSAVLHLREKKRMVHHRGDPMTRGAGSFFTNPEVGLEVLDRIASSQAGDVPHWQVSPGRVKLSGGWLVERSGYPRGLRRGNVAISEAHALAILNLTGEATAAEIIEFAGAVRRGVLDTFGVGLVPEPVLMGFEADEMSEVGLDGGSADDYPNR